MMRSLSHFLFGTLRGRLIVGAVLVHAAMMTLFVADLTVRQRGTLLERQEEEAIAISVTLATSGAGWLAANDVSGLQELIDIQRQHPEVLFAIVVDRNGLVLADSDRSRVGSYMLDLPDETRLTVVSRTPALVDVAVPAVIGGLHVGWARVGVGQDLAARRLEEITRDGIIYTLVAILLGAIVAGLMGRVLTRRLYSVQQTMNAVRAGDRLARSTLGGEDEAAIFAREFNSMLDAIAQRNAQLRSSEERYRTLIYKVQTAIVLHDGQAMIVEANPLALQILGAPLEQLTGHSLMDQGRIFLQADGSPLLAADDPVSRVLSTGLPLHNLSLGLRRPGQESIIWVLLSAEPEIDEQGGIARVIVSFVDITEGRLLEQEKEQYLRFFTLATEVMCIAVPNGQFKRVNPMFTRLMGYSESELLGRPLLDFVHPDDRQKTLDEIAELPRRAALSFENRYICKDGSALLLSWNAFYDEADGVIYASARDITEMRRAEVALREKEEMLQKMMEAARDAVLMMDHDGHISLWNHAAQQMFGYSSAEALGKDLHQLIAPARFHKDFNKAFQQFQKTGEGAAVGKTVELAAVHKNGDEFPVELSLSAVKIKEQWHAIGIARDITERQHTQSELQRSENRLKEAQRLSLLGNWELDLRKNELVWSDEIYLIFEIDPLEFQASYEQFLLAIHPEDRDMVNKTYQESVSNKQSYQIVHRILLRDDRIKYVQERGETFYDESGKALRSIGTVQDITASKLSELALQRANRNLRLLSDCNMALVHADDEQKLLHEICRLCVERGGYLMAWVGFALQDEARTVSPVATSGQEQGYLDDIKISWAENEFGKGPTGTAIRTGRPNIAQNVLSDPRMKPWRAAALQRGYQSSVSLPLIGDTHVLGALTLYAREADVFDPQEVKLLAELASDLAYGIVTLRSRVEHAAAKEKLQFLAHFDELTHLPNRLLLHDRFEHAALTARSENRILALLYLDLDRFKQINDSLGYAVGDEVIVMIVERLQASMPAAATISRLTGDEFVVLLTGNLDVPVVAGFANTIRDALLEPLKVNEHALNVSCSIGIGLYPSDGDEFDTLLKHAHAALDSAKEAGRNTYRFFSREMNTGLAEQIRLSGGLTDALRKQQFVLHYQPQIDIHSRRIIGAEALIRWQHPEDGLLAPDRFIGLAERSGHIVQIGEWVLNEACAQAKRWLDQQKSAPVVAVNLSALQFKGGNVLEMVAAALTASGLPAQYLELELTESILVQDVKGTMKTLHDLKVMGVKLAIDDFGTGYSSLSYLKQLAVDKIKIDQSFVRDMLTDTDSASIVRAVIQLGHNLQLTVIAEGVETSAQLELLEAAQCDEAQGFLFSRPVVADQFTELLKKNGEELH